MLKELTEMSLEDIISKGGTKRISLDILKANLQKYYEDSFGKIDDDDMRSLRVLNKMFRDKNFGFIYFLKNNDNGMTKIGYTSNLPKRMSEIKSVFNNYLGSDVNLSLELLNFTHKSLLKDLENDLHMKLVDKRKFGEWFDLSDCDFIKDAIMNSIYHERIDGVDIIIDDSMELHLYENFSPSFNLNDSDVIMFYNLESIYKGVMEKYLINEVSYIYDTILNMKCNINDDFIGIFKLENFNKKNTVRYY